MSCGGNCENCKSKEAAPEEKWREDFPVEWAADNYVTRRDFTRFLILTSGATFLGNGYFVAKNALTPRAESGPTVKIATTTELPIGGVKLFRYPTEADPAMLIRLAEERFVAFRQRCTHLSCPVHFNAEKTQLDCPCHNGTFDARTGRVLGGPPPRPLPRIALKLENGEIFAAGLASSDEAEG